MDYEQLLTTMIGSSRVSLIHGKTIIFIWNDENHLQEWYSHKNITSDSVRIATLPSSFLPMLSTGTENRNDVCIVAVGCGVKEDYSDTRCLFHMVIKIN